MAKQTQDVVILGAGAIGCSIGWRLAQAGLSVTLVERTRPGAEATSAAAGILSAQAEGEEDGALFRLLSRSEALYEAFARELGERADLTLGYARVGLLEVALDEGEPTRLERRLSWQQRAGLPIEALDGAGARAREPALGPGLRSALFFPRAARLDPRGLGQALWECAREAGCRLHLGQARALRLHGGRVVGVELDGTQADPCSVLNAEIVVIAAGAWSSLIAGLGLTSNAVRPMRGQLARLEGPSPALRAIVFGAGGYVVPQAGGRITVGSTQEDVGFDKAVTHAAVERLLARAERLCPSLAGRRVEALWAGLRPMTSDGRPALGPVPGVPGLRLAVGHGRNGILLTPVTAEILAQGILGTPPALASELTAARLF